MEASTATEPDTFIVIIQKKTNLYWGLVLGFGIGLVSMAVFLWRLGVI